jgi:hypothetical protein
MLLDTDGFCIPFSTDDQIIEAGCDDPDYGEPNDWPDWCDSHRYTAADVAWLNDNPILPPIAGGALEPFEPFEPTDAEWDELHAASYGPDDNDIAAGGLAVG